MHRLLTLFSTFLLSFTVLANPIDCTTNHCVAVIDAGSSGSRLHVYAYELDKTNTPVQITEVWNRRVVPGLSVLESEHVSISAYLDKLFTDAPAAPMPVYFYSTAGMRLLPKTHHKKVYQLVSNWFDRQHYWHLISARTITGNEEGLFAWLATNYQLKLLDQDEKPLVGAMDIGGASVQIVFPISNESTIDNKDKVTIDLYGRHYPVFAHSFLGLGQNEMGHQYFDLNVCYPNEYELPGGAKGRGDAYACRNEITTLVNQVHYVNKKIKSVLTLNPVDTWYLIGGVTNLLNDKLFPFPNQQFTNQELTLFANKTICHQKWSDLEEHYPNNYMLYNYCMLSSYLSALIMNGYGLQASKPINFLPPNKNVDWTIGVVLQHHQT